MANEVYTQIQLKATKNGATINQTSADRADMTGAALMQSTQNIGTTAELVSFGDITGVPQAVMIVNLDATNYIEIGGDSGLTVFKLKVAVGKTALINPTSATLYAKANTAAVNILVLAVEA